MTRREGLDGGIVTAYLETSPGPIGREDGHMRTFNTQAKERVDVFMGQSLNLEKHSTVRFHKMIIKTTISSKKFKFRNGIKIDLYRPAAKISKGGGGSLLGKSGPLCGVDLFGKCGPF